MINHAPDKSVATISRPMAVFLENAVATVTGSVTDDIHQLIEALEVVLRRCLALPHATWPTLVHAAASCGEWDHWRVIGLLGAANLVPEVDPSAARDVLVEVAVELASQRTLVAGHTDGSADGPAADGRRRRNLVTAMERAIEALTRGEAEHLVTIALIVETCDLELEYPTLPSALRSAATDFARSMVLTSTTRAALVVGFGATPFAAALPMCSAKRQPDSIQPDIASRPTQMEDRP